MSDDLLSEFIFDSREHLGAAGSHLLDLEKDPGSLDSLNALMGAMHTIKGNSGFLDLKELYHLMHQAESLLQTIREKRLACPPPVIELLLQVMDTAEAILSRLENGESGSVDWLAALNQTLSETDAKLEADGLSASFAPAPEASGSAPVGPATPAGPAASLTSLGTAASHISLLSLDDGALGLEGAALPARVEALFQDGLEGLAVDLRTLTSLTAVELKSLLALVGRGRPEKTAFLVDQAGQPGLWRLFQVLELTGSWHFFPAPEPALAFLES